ncbi:hypothetical protein P7C70_g2536, partial [Phenoliferia sp. Uapishka_3]
MGASAERRLLYLREVKGTNVGIAIPVSFPSKLDAPDFVKLQLGKPHLRRPKFSFASIKPCPRLNATLSTSLRPPPHTRLPNSTGQRLITRETTFGSEFCERLNTGYLGAARLSAPLLTRPLHPPICLDADQLHGRLKERAQADEKRSYFAVAAQAAKLAGTGTRYTDEEEAAAGRRGMAVPDWVEARARGGQVAQRKALLSDLQDVDSEGDGSEGEATKLTVWEKRESDQALMSRVAPTNSMDHASLKAAILAQSDWTHLKSPPSTSLQSLAVHDLGGKEKHKKKRKRVGKRTSSPPHLMLEDAPNYAVVSKRNNTVGGRAHDHPPKSAMKKTLPPTRLLPTATLTPPVSIQPVHSDPKSNPQPRRHSMSEHDDEPSRPAWDQEAIDSGEDALEPNLNGDDPTFEALDGFSQVSLAEHKPGPMLPSSFSHTDADMPDPTPSILSFPTSPSSRLFEQDPPIVPATIFSLPPSPTLLLPTSQRSVAELYYTALASSFDPPLKLPPAFFSPIEAGWKGPSCMKKSQRTALSDIWTWKDDDFGVAAHDEDELVPVEGMGLGCKGLTKADLKAKRERERDLQFAWEMAENERKSEDVAAEQLEKLAKEGVRDDIPRGPSHSIEAADFSFLGPCTYFSPFFWRPASPGVSDHQNHSPAFAFSASLLRSHESPIEEAVPTLARSSGSCSSNSKAIPQSSRNSPRIPTPTPSISNYATNLSQIANLPSSSPDHDMQYHLPNDWADFADAELLKELEIAVRMHEEETEDDRLEQELGEELEEGELRGGKAPSTGTIEDFEARQSETNNHSMGLVATSFCGESTQGEENLDLAAMSLDDAKVENRRDTAFKLFDDDDLDGIAEFD